MFNIILVFICCVFTSYSHVFPILDGRTTPIFVESHYTFTNFEWARGFVVFKNGFSVNNTNTIILDLAYPINQVVNLGSGGTIILNSDIILDQDCSIANSGFIKTNGNTIYFSRPDFIITSTLYFITDDVIFDGNRSGALSFQPFTGMFNFTQVSKVSFKNMILSLKNPIYEIIFPTAKLTSLTFQDVTVSLFPHTTFTAQTNDVIFDGISSIVGEKARFISPVTFEIIPNGLFTLGELTTLTVRGFDIGGVESVFTISNLATLEFSNLGTTGIVGNGRFLCNGKATIKAQNQIVNMKGTQYLVINSGSRLILDRVRLKVM